MRRTVGGDWIETSRSTIDLEPAEFSYLAVSLLCFFSRSAIAVESL